MRLLSSVDPLPRPVLKVAERKYDIDDNDLSLSLNNNSKNDYSLSSIMLIMTTWTEFLFALSSHKKLNNADNDYS